MFSRIANQQGLQIGIGYSNPPTQLAKRQLPPPDHASDGLFGHIQYLRRRCWAKVTVLAATAMGAESPGGSVFWMAFVHNDRILGTNKGLHKCKLK